MKKTHLLLFLAIASASMAAPSSLETEVSPEQFRFGLGLEYFVGGSGFLASTLFQFNSVHSLQVGGGVQQSMGHAGRILHPVLLAHYRAQVGSFDRGGVQLGVGTFFSQPGSSFAVLPSAGIQYRPLSNLVLMLDGGPALGISWGQVGVGLLLGLNVHVLL